MSPAEHTLLVLISGSGTNLQALIDACKSHEIPSTRVCRVISNRKSAYGLERARLADIPATYHNLVSYKKKHPDTEEGIQAAREAYDVDLAKIIVEENPTLVVCAGWMHILSTPFVTSLQGASIPIINLHPALPGAFNGANAIERAWEAFQHGEIAATGVMIHYVISEVDMGEPILVRDIECRTGESESELETRIHEVEWEVIVEGTRKALDAATSKWKSP
jgi:phosphoribosylglycinamide formyltransferase